MQLHNLSSSQETLARTQANILAADIIDRMRGNYLQATRLVNNDYHTLKANPSSAMSGIADCDANSCTTQQLAGYDIHGWKQNLETQLPVGKGNIVSQTVAGVRTYTVIVYFTNMQQQERMVVVEAVL